MQIENLMEIEYKLIESKADIAKCQAIHNDSSFDLLERENQFQIAKEIVEAINKYISHAKMNFKIDSLKLVPNTPENCFEAARSSLSIIATEIREEISEMLAEKEMSGAVEPGMR
jgi:hypothetical protein